jgi:hypothetical protein
VAADLSRDPIDGVRDVPDRQRAVEDLDDGTDPVAARWARSATASTGTPA